MLYKPTRKMSKPEIIRIANGQGFWGDSLLGPIRLVNEGPLDYLTLDYLAEVSMSIMQKLRDRDPNGGYAQDFIRLCERILPTCQEKGIRIVTNAGGVSPEACREALFGVIRKLGLTGIKVGIVTGDDISDRLPELIKAGHTLENLDNGEPLEPVLDKVKTANVYMGASSIIEALEKGADIVITGRVTDPAMVLGPLVHEFGWSMQNMDLLASATIAGHLVECGTQCTGGNYTNWRDVADMARMGYPVVEAYPDGSFVVTKHEGTGGLVNVETVASQLVYEMGDPKYISADCIADFSTVKLEQQGENRVHVSGVKGEPPTDSLKVSIAYEDGYKVLGQLTIAGPDAIDKANLCADIVFERVAMEGIEFADEDRFVELVGTNACHAGIVPVPDQPAEVVLRIGARSHDRNKLNRLGMEIVPLVTSGPPGVTGYAGGRPKAREIIGYWPALIDRTLVKTDVSVEEA